MKKRFGGQSRHHSINLPPDLDAPGQAGLGLQHHRRGYDSQEIIFGVEPVLEIIAAAPARILTLYLKLGAEARFEPQIRAIKANGGEVVTASNHDLTRITGRGARHQGIVATVREYTYQSFEQVLLSKPNPLLLLDGITDPRNLGAIMRSSECAGIRAIVLAKDRTVGLTPAAIKSSAGAWAHLAVARCGNVAHALEQLKGEGYWVAAMDPEGGTSLYDLDVTRRLTLVLGSEGHGIRDIVRKTADFIVRIPVYGRISSLNVSVAAAIALFEIVRRRADRPSNGDV